MLSIIIIFSDFQERTTAPSRTQATLNLRPPQEIRIAPMSPDVAQPGYRALPLSESDYPPSRMPRTTVNRSEKQGVTNHTQATPRPGSTQPGRTPREGQIITPSATGLLRPIDRPETDSEKPSPPNRDRKEAVSRPMSTPPKFPREQAERMVPYAVPERIRRAERRSEQSPLSSQNHTMLLNRPEIPTRATRAPLKHASSDIREAAPAAPMDDVETLGEECYRVSRHRCDSINIPASTDRGYAGQSLTTRCMDLIWRGPADIMTGQTNTSRKMSGSRPSPMATEIPRTGTMTCVY
ncbi:hypothetical protein IW261DRAFT_658833 [Armillaria novae-zelandiae]|uniref:Uncharacterized protein n=1 Tax=Armillaria novae-zelandiae TaxID=153914 RepID=A0AA39UCQ9_9AGAR|nr:hypothetical protein IW261DRAFT_658833 [Armillaria novae-zelandiae]